MASQFHRFGWPRVSPTSQTKGLLIEMGLHFFQLLNIGCIARDNFNVIFAPGFHFASSTRPNAKHIDQSVRVLLQGLRRCDSQVT